MVLHVRMLVNVVTVAVKIMMVMMIYICDYTDDEYSDDDEVEDDDVDENNDDQ